jgi:hypothetical protein
MVKTVLMKATSATSERVLLAGKVYRLNGDDAKSLVEGEQVTGADGKPQLDVKGKPVMSGGYAEYYSGPRKPERIPAQPDPEDIPVPVDEDDE